MTQLLTTKDVADLLHLAEVTVRKMVSAKRIPHLKIGTSVRFDATVISDWVKAHEKAAISESNRDRPQHRKPRRDRDE